MRRHTATGVPLLSAPNLAIDDAYLPSKRAAFARRLVEVTVPWPPRPYSLTTYTMIHSRMGLTALARFTGYIIVRRKDDFKKH